MDFSLALAGFAVGFIVGMTGVGGGSLMTPLLVLVFGVKPAVAVGTDLLYAAITKSAGVFVHHKNGAIQWPIVWLLLSGSLPASVVSILFIRRLDLAGVDYDRLIMTALSIALILTALFLLGRDKMRQISHNQNLAALRRLAREYRKPCTVLAGVLIGLLVTISSVGAGVIGAAFLFFLYPRYRAIQIVATDIAHAIPVTFIAGLGHAHIGTVDYVLLVNMLAGSIPGIYLGSHCGAFLPERLMRPLLAGVLLLIGVKLVV